MPSPNDTLSPIAFDARFIAAIRCLLSIVVWLILALDPLAHTRLAAVTYLILSLYVVYSIILYTAARWWYPIVPRPIEPWLDVGWAIGLTALSGDPSGIFAEFSFFAVLIAAFQWGLTSGFRMALVTAFLLLSVGIALGQGDADVGYHQVLLGPASLLLLGYMTASFGGQEITLKRRLSLLKDVTRISNPRFGVDRTMGLVVERIRVFYDADACLLIMPDACHREYQLRHADRQNPERAVRAEVLPEELRRLLLAWPEHHAILYGGTHGVRQRWSHKTRAEVVDLKRGTRLAADAQLCEAVAGVLNANVFISVPLVSPYVTGGRLYLTAATRRTFEFSDMDFLLQVFDHTMPVLHNIALVDQLASDAADVERQRIALDFHDGVIQPYIGLQMGLEAVRQKVGRDDADVAHDLACLIHLTKDEIAQLRHMIHGLKSGGERVSDLVSAIRRFALKFSAATGIRVRVESNSALHVNDRLGAEVFHIITEGLSNVRRHTQAATVTITLGQKNGHLVVQISNDGIEADTFSLFSPCSITERTTALGGWVRVERQGPTQAAVIVEIPL